MKAFLLLCSILPLVAVTSLAQDQNESRLDWLLEQAKSKSNIFGRSKGDKAITLLAYESRGMVNGDVAMERILQDDAPVLEYMSDRDYEVVSMEETKKNNPEKYALLQGQLEQAVTLMPDEVEMLELTWAYKGKEIVSLAFVGKDGDILYDNIGYNLRTSDEEIRWGDARESNLPNGYRALRSGKANDKVFYIHGTGPKNLYGEELWRFNIRCTSAFDEKKTLQSFRYECNSSAAMGWACSANASSVNGNKMGEDTYAEFAWAYAYGECPATTEWEGNSYRAYGQHTSSGTGVHRADM